MTVKAVIFDLDDTLLLEVPSAEAAFLATCEMVRDTYGIDPDAFHQRLRHDARTLWHASPERELIERISISHWEGLWAKFEGHDPAMTRLRQWAVTYRQQSWRRALQAFNINDPAFADTLSREFRRQRETRHVVFDDARPLLNQLQGRFKLGLMTNGLSCLQREKITGSGLAPYFDAMVIAGDVGVSKPDARIFHALLRQLQVTPTQAIMVGNSVKGDIAGAQAVGMKAVLIHRGRVHGADDSIIPDHLICHLDQLPDILKRYQNPEHHQEPVPKGESK